MKRSELQMIYAIEQGEIVNIIYFKKEVILKWQKLMNY